MMKLILTDSEWLRGEGWESLLYRAKDKKKCCLGVCLVDLYACPVKYLDDIGSPEGLNHEEFKLPTWMAPRGIGEDAPLIKDMIKINDAKGVSDEERVEKLKPLFAKVGIELEFRPEE